MMHAVYVSAERQWVVVFSNGDSEVTSTGTNIMSAAYRLSLIADENTYLIVVPLLKNRVL